MKKFLKLAGYDPIEKQTSVKTEIIAGIVTFLAMAYILTVNPAQILVGVENAAVIVDVGADEAMTEQGHILPPTSS